ncbi:hypothetical protein ACFW1M_22410 [Streptomyces inhibens]|uniref:hypothetical protein n=1 Tax=Streptomyces inhibens TaxID=2293571 RepID=UPI0036A6FD5D
MAYVRANENWSSGGIARLASEPHKIGPACERALHRPGYDAEPAPEAVSGAGLAPRFRKADQQHLCPALQIPRSVDDWDPWSCDLTRGHDGPHHHHAVNYLWVDDTDARPCGAWAGQAPGYGYGSCGLPPATLPRSPTATPSGKP